MAKVRDEYPYGLRMAVLRNDLGVAKTCLVALLDEWSSEKIQDLLIDITLDSAYYLVGEIPSDLSDKSLWSFTKKLTLCPTNRDTSALFYIQPYLINGNIKSLSHPELDSAYKMYLKGITWTSEQLVRNLISPSKKLSRYERSVLVALSEWAAATGEMNYRFLAAIAFMLVIKRGLDWRVVKQTIKERCSGIKGRKVTTLPWWTVSPTSQVGNIARGMITRRFGILHTHVLILWLLFQCDWGTHLDDAKLTFADQVWWNPYAMVVLKKDFGSVNDTITLWKEQVEPCLEEIVTDLRS